MCDADTPVTGVRIKGTVHMKAEGRQDFGISTSGSMHSILRG